MENWKIEKNLCRCCHSEGSFRALSEQCCIGGEDQLSDKLRLALNIHLKPVDGPLKTQTYTICDSCVLRLQDAISFRQQVMKCEERFQDMYTRGAIKERATSLEAQTDYATDSHVSLDNPLNSKVKIEKASSQEVSSSTKPQFNVKYSPTSKIKTEGARQSYADDALTSNIKVDGTLSPEELAEIDRIHNDGLDHSDFDEIAIHVTKKKRKTHIKREPDDDVEIGPIRKNALEIPINDAPKTNTIEGTTNLKAEKIEIHDSDIEIVEAVNIVKVNIEEYIGIPQQLQKEDEISNIIPRIKSIDDTSLLGIEIDDSDVEIVEAVNIGITEVKSEKYIDISQQFHKEDETSNIAHIKPLSGTSVQINCGIETTKAADVLNGETEQFIRHKLLNEEVTIMENDSIPKIELGDSDVEIVDTEEESEEAIKKELMNGDLVDYDDLQALMNFTTFLEGGKTAYCCCECGITRSSIDLIQKHTQKHLGEENSQHTCPECPVKLSKKDFIQHRIDMHGAVMPTCKVCGYKDVEQTLIDKHQKLHPKKKCPCPYCGIEFNQKSLKKHLYEHNPLRPFGCSICSRRFSTNGGLQTHKRMSHCIKRR